MPRGRPLGSDVRQRIIEIVKHLGKDYGYNIFKVYSKIFPEVSMRLVYYHLNKGVELGVFNSERIQSVQGNYSWGDTAQKVFYSLGENAFSSGDAHVEEFFRKLKESE